MKQIQTNKIRFKLGIVAAIVAAGALISFTRSESMPTTTFCDDKSFAMPDSFTPNDDGVNDVFYPRSNDSIKVKVMQVYSRYGEKMFEQKNFKTNDPSKGWDGLKDGKKANPGNYFYIIELICEYAEVRPYKGTLTLIR